MTPRTILRAAGLALATILFSVTPALVGGVPLDRRLSSDAEWYAAAMLRSTDPPQLIGDPSQPLDIRGTGETVLTTALARIGQAAGLDLLSWSVAVSMLALVAFVVTVYAVVRSSVDEVTALLVAAASIVSVHALGGATYSFAALGYLPRDLMLAPAIALIGWWVTSGPAGRWRVFGAVGLASWLYPVLFAHLALALGTAEVLRERRIDRRLAGCALACAVGALPTLLDVGGRATTAVDVDIIRFRMAYQIVSDPIVAVSQYLRRVLVYAALVGALAIVLRRSDLLRGLGPWFALAAASLTIAVAGALAESARPELIRFLVSRTAVFFIFAAMVITAAALPRAAAVLGVRRAGIVAVVAVFVFQSGLVSVTRDLVALRGQRDAVAGFHAAVAAITRLTAPADLVTATSEEVPDLAASLRTYARRPVWQTYKDIGVAQVDGARGRAAYERWREQREVLSSGDAERIVMFMRAHGIKAALVPAGALRHPGAMTVERVGGHAILLAPPSADTR